MGGIVAYAMDGLLPSTSLFARVQCSVAQWRSEEISNMIGGWRA
jgi:hypothetical protein